MSWDDRIYDKYRVEHTDGTPLKGKKYFVLRLDSDDPVEAARVAAAMRAYKGEPRNCDIGTPREQADRSFAFCRGRRCKDCEFTKLTFRECTLAWAQLPYAGEGEKERKKEKEGT